MDITFNGRKSDQIQFFKSLDKISSWAWAHCTSKINMSESVQNILGHYNTLWIVNISMRI